MIHYVRHHEVDTLKWDRCINGDPSCLPYGLHWYLDLTAREWDALVVDDYQAVFPLPHNRRWGIPYVFRPYGVQQLGLFGKDAEQDMLAAVLRSIPSRFLWVDYCLNEQNPTASVRGMEFQEQNNQILDLAGSYESIYDRYNQRTRRNIKKARKERMKIFEYDSPDVLLDVFKANKGAELSSWTQWHYDRMRLLMYQLIHKRRGFVWTLHDETNTACAGVFIVQYRNRLVALFTAVNAYGKERGAMSFLLDELFILYSNKDMFFDFEGSNIKGLAEFNAGFGAVSRPYQRIIKSRIPFLRKFRK